MGDRVRTHLDPLVGITTVCILTLNRAISPRIVLIPRVPDLFFSRSALFLQNKSGTCVH